jgi:hypothetical protein
LKKSHADIDEWQTQMQLGPMSIGNIQLYSDKLTSQDRALTGVDCVSSLQQAVDRSLARNDDREVAVISEGPYVIPFYRTSESIAGG